VKVNAKALFEVIRSVVRDELRQALPELVREHLAEHYVRRVIAEQVGQPSPEFSKEMSDLLEAPIAPRTVRRVTPPAPVRPSHLPEPVVIPGIPSFLTENVQPLSADDGATPTMLPDFGGFDMSAIADISSRLDKKAAKKSNNLVSTNPAPLDEPVNTRFTG